MKKEIRLSQCMIVKNEEKNIERALSWGKSFMWEQIVVDTGSTDRTVEIARRLGAKVYHFEWIDDFAAAKNYAVSQAQGDWIVFLDADEYLRGQSTMRLSPDGCRWRAVRSFQAAGRRGTPSGFQRFGQTGVQAHCFPVHRQGYLGTSRGCGIVEGFMRSSMWNMGNCGNRMRAASCPSCIQATVKRR